MQVVKLNRSDYNAESFRLQCSSKANVFATATVEPIELIRSIKVLVQLNIGYKGLNVLLRDAVGHFFIIASI